MLFWRLLVGFYNTLRVCGLCVCACIRVYTHQMSSVRPVHQFFKEMMRLLCTMQLSINTCWSQSDSAVTHGVLLWRNKLQDWHLDEDVFLNIPYGCLSLMSQSYDGPQVHPHKCHYYTSEGSQSPSNAGSWCTCRWDDVMFIQQTWVTSLSIKEQISNFPPCIPAQLLWWAAKYDRHFNLHF